MSSVEFQGKHVVVTGAGSGLGRAIAEGFCRSGAKVLFADIVADNSQQAAQEMQEFGFAAEACDVDVTNANSVARMMDKVGQKLDVLVCAAGIFKAGTAEQTSDADWEKVFNVNVSGTFFCAREAIKKMRPHGGSIITISSSTGAHDAIQGAAAYVASKGAVTMLTKALAVDHAAENIRVNSIAPGPTDTPMLRALMNEDDRLKFAQSLPIQRLGTPSDFVGAALFLGGDHSRFITGAILPVDGGQTALI